MIKNWLSDSYPPLSGLGNLFTEYTDFKIKVFLALGEDSLEGIDKVLSMVPRLERLQEALLNSLNLKSRMET